MTFEYPTLHFLHLQINSSVSSWLQRHNAPCSPQVCYTPTGLQLQQTHKPIHGWRARTLIPFGYHLSFPPPPSACPPPPVTRMEMKRFLCFSQRGAGKRGWPLIGQFRSGESPVHRLGCGLWRGQVSCHSQPTSRGDSEDAAFDRPGSWLRSQKELLEKSCILLLPAAKLAIDGNNNNYFHLCNYPTASHYNFRSKNRSGSVFCGKKK